MLTIVVIFLFSSVSTRTHFRSLLLERACQKRPSLDFCNEFTTTLAPTTTTTLETTTPKLVPPPVVLENSTLAANQTKTGDDDLGTLLRLPKPTNTNRMEEKTIDPFDDTVESNTTSLPHIPPPEDEKTVLVYISEYCVVERERFVKSCHGNVIKTDLSFCKSYPPACASAPGVLPVISYCQRYYKFYPKHCTGTTIKDGVIQFCYAFEQFCLPELTPAKPPAKQSPEQQPKSTLKRCEDVVNEARKVCNPFPHPKDTFNVIRCSNFLTNCREFIDWS